MDPPRVELVASTDNPNGFLPPRRNGTPAGLSFFKSVQWSADGTTLFTSSYSNRVCAFVLPETLLEPRQSPLVLTATSTLVLPEPTSAIAPCPYFALEHPSTQVLLTASTDHPIHIHHAFPPPPPSSSSPSSSSSSSPSHSFPNHSDHHNDDDDGGDDDDDDPTNPFTPPPRPPQPPPLASFHLIKHETEAYLPVASLLWPAPGTHFVAGAANRIALFDVSRPDALRPQPLLTIPTIPSARHLAKGGGVGMRGTVSALGAQPFPSPSSSSWSWSPSSSGAAGESGWGPGSAAASAGGVGGGLVGLLAAGTWTRSLGLYDVMRSGESVATWGVADAAREAGVGGKGVLQTLWSPCGRYLVVNERGATGLLVYDVRGTRRLLGWLEGRDGRTNQRLSCDVFPGTEATGGFEVWAGTKDGGVVVWEAVGSREGALAPSWSWKAHDSAVGAAAMHMSGSVVATCSGSWKIFDEDRDDSSDDSEESSSDAARGPRGCARSRVVVQETSLKVWSLGLSKPSPARTEDRNEDEAES